MTANENMRLMKMLDDAWNSQDWHTFRKLHTKNVAVYWPGQSKPTIGLHIHQKEAQMFFNAFPDNHIDNVPYLGTFRSGRLDLFNCQFYWYTYRSNGW